MFEQKMFLGFSQGHIQRKQVTPVDSQIRETQKFVSSNLNKIKQFLVE